tara:strand:+ start:197 stop:328 length:132 start_codon:yes stop_codon:yes gene_type:complete
MLMSGALAVGGFGDYDSPHPTKSTAAIAAISMCFIGQKRELAD